MHKTKKLINRAGFTASLLLLFTSLCSFCQKNTPEKNAHLNICFQFGLVNLDNFSCNDIYGENPHFYSLKPLVSTYYELNSWSKIGNNLFFETGFGFSRSWYSEHIRFPQGNNFIINGETFGLEIQSRFYRLLLPICLGYDISLSNRLSLQTKLGFVLGYTENMLEGTKVSQETPTGSDIVFRSQFIINPYDHISLSLRSEIAVDLKLTGKSALGLAAVYDHSNKKIIMGNYSYYLYNHLYSMTDFFSNLRACYITFRYTYNFNHLAKKY